MLSLSDEIKELSELHQSGVLTDKEFAEAKQAVIAGAKCRANPFVNQQTVSSGVALPSLSATPTNIECSSQTEMVAESREKINENLDRKICYRRERCCLQLRLERSVKGIEEKGDLNYFIGCFTSDFSGDFLASASKSLNVLEKIIRNFEEEPNNPKYKRLKMSNKNVKSFIVQQLGPLEFLVHCGATCEGDSEVGAEEIVLDGVDCHRALALLSAIKAAFNEVKLLREEERVKKAKSVTNAAIERERRRIARETEVPLTSPKRSKEEIEKQQGKSNRVSLEDAIKHLTQGKPTL